MWCSSRLLKSYRARMIDVLGTRLARSRDRANCRSLAFVFVYSGVIPVSSLVRILWAPSLGVSVVNQVELACAATIKKLLFVFALTEQSYWCSTHLYFRPEVGRRGVESGKAVLGVPVLRIESTKGPKGRGQSKSRPGTRDVPSILQNRPVLPMTAQYGIKVCWSSQCFPTSLQSFV